MASFQLAQSKRFSSWQARTLARINKRLRAALPKGSQPLEQAMRYATLEGGKRLRPLLCLAVAHDYGGNSKLATHAACAVEMLHCYSLVHDDLPCMDNDVLRRGKPTCHVRFGEATALLAGDGLQATAYSELALAKLGDTGFAELSRSSGVAGMVGGQALDIAKTSNKLRLLRAMHERKTGALFVAAARLGGMAAQVSAKDMQSISAMARKFGLLFQITDDIANEIQPARTSGKPQGTDLMQGNCTYVTVLGMDKARKHLRQAWQSLQERLVGAPLAGGITEQLCNWVFPNINKKPS